MKLNLDGLMVLTPSGFRPFAGVSVMAHNADTIQISFSDGSELVVTPNHKFETNVQIAGGVVRSTTIHAQSLSIGCQLNCTDGNVVAVVDIKPGPKQDVYDLVEVGDNVYNTGSVISHNCQFLSSDPLLIDSLILNQLETQTIEPDREDMGFKFFQEFKPDKTYIVGVDPATGTGEDFTVILVVDHQDLSLVAEYRSNTVSSTSAYSSLKLVLNKIGSMNSTALFSVENNGVGEGIIALYENDETVPECAEFVSEDGKDKLGMRTESRVKLRTCLKLKQMIESGTMPVSSPTMLKELKSFVATKGSYSAQYGATDDIVCAALIVIRILEEMAQYDQDSFDKVHDYQDTGHFKGDTGDYDDTYEPDGMII